jgi:hypothetical protein
LIEAMTSDIEEGNFCDILLNPKIKINDDDNVIRKIVILRALLPLLNA